MTENINEAATTNTRLSATSDTRITSKNLGIACKKDDFIDTSMKNSEEIHSEAKTNKHFSPISQVDK